MRRRLRPDPLASVVDLCCGLPMTSMGDAAGALRWIRLEGARPPII